MVQVPAPMKLTVEPDTVHFDVVAELKVTARPEVEVAVTV